MKFYFLKFDYGYLTDLNLSALIILFLRKTAVGADVNRLAAARGLELLAELCRAMDLAHAKTDKQFFKKSKM